MCRWGEHAKEEDSEGKAPQSQASVPGSRPRLGPLPPASPVAPTDQHCTQVFAASSLDDLRDPGGEACCVCFWSVGSVWARGHHGRPPAATSPAHHLPEKTLLPALPLLPAPATRGLDPAVLCLLPLPQRCSLRSRLQQPEGRAASVRCFSSLAQLKGPSEVSRRGGDLGCNLGLS